MPTRHRRINVVRDPQLADALRRAAPALRGRTEAARLRELALIGERSLSRMAGADELARARQALQHELRAAPERGDLVRTAKRVLQANSGRARKESASESLGWARGEL
jgi:hypothetical protein